MYRGIPLVFEMIYTPGSRSLTTPLKVDLSFAGLAMGSNSCPVGIKQSPRSGELLAVSLRRGRSSPVIYLYGGGLIDLYRNTPIRWVEKLDTSVGDMELEQDALRILHTRLKNLNPIELGHFRENPERTLIFDPIEERYIHLKFKGGETLLKAKFFKGNSRWWMNIEELMQTNTAIAFDLDFVPSPYAMFPGEDRDYTFMELGSRGVDSRRLALRLWSHKLFRSSMVFATGLFEIMHGAFEVLEEIERVLPNFSMAEVGISQNKHSLIIPKEYFAQRIVFATQPV